MNLYEEVEKIYKEALAIIEERQGAYGEGWKSESLDFFLVNVARKYKGFKFQLKNRNSQPEKLLEQAIDLLNYIATAYSKLKSQETYAKIGIETPTELVYLLDDETDFIPILVQRLKDKKFLEYIKSSKKIKVLNGRLLLEEKKTGPVKLEDFYRAIDLVKPDYVISPDYYPQDNENPAERTLEIYLDVKKHFDLFKIFGTITGGPENLEMLLNVYGNKIALPYDMFCRWEDPGFIKMARRADLVNRLGNVGLYLLGMTGLEELAWYADFPQVRFLATGLPVRMGLNKLEMEYNSNKVYSSMLGMPSAKKVTMEVLELIRSNIETVRSQLGKK